MKTDFNRGWIFSGADSREKTVNLPHDAMLEEKRTAKCLNGKNTGFFPGGIYHYRKEFDLDEQDCEKYIALEFEGIYRNAAIYLNGEKIAVHNNGYTGFTVDLSDRIRKGKNMVEIQVDNHLEPNSRWYSGSGIYRPVWLIKKHRKHIQNLQITTLSIHPPRIRVTAEGAEDAVVEIYEEDRLVKTGKTGVLKLDDARLWDAGHPHLYTCVVKTETDEERSCFGVRKLSWSAEKGFLVNGRRTLLRGGCIHHDNGILGACAFEAAEKRKIRILKECGFNAVRSAHNPCSKALLDACNRLGMYVMDESFDGWYTPKTYHDYSRTFEANHLDDLMAMVQKDYNHPSVIMYSIGNEVTETAQEKGILLAEQMTEAIHAVDETRPVTCGINAALNLLSSRGQGIYQDREEYKAEPLPVSDSKSEESKTGSALFNFLMQKMNTVTSWMGGSSGAGKAIEQVAEKLDIVGLNYGERRYRKDISEYPDRIMVGSETLISDLAHNWSCVRKYPSVVGDFCWSAWDYLGETGLGSWEYATEKGLPLTAGCGAVDLIGVPGAENAYQKVVWNLRKEPYIGVRPVNHTGETPACGRWRFTNATDSWNWFGMEGKKAVIEVYAKASRVALFLNGKKQGEKKVKNYRAVFKIVYLFGVLEAVAYSADGKELSRSRLVSGTGPARLRVTADKKILKADGQDLCFLQIEMTDENGNVCPLSHSHIRIEVAGAGTLQGFGSAATKTDETFQKPVHSLYQGRALAAVRAGYELGSVEIRISADNCAA